MIIEHGTWTYYTPDQLPHGAPASAIFARRQSDGQDWYELVANPPFAPNNIIMTVDAQNVVWAATRDPSMIFPARFMVIEMDDTTTENPQEAFGYGRYRYVDGSITPIATSKKDSPVAALTEALQEAMARIEKLEAGNVGRDGRDRG